MSNHMSWVTSWEVWRQTMGHEGSRQRKNVLSFLESHPAILYWGDSWFSTPLYLNLARQSARRINGLSMIIGKPGAEAAELFSGREVVRIGDRIANNPFDVVCLSAGGNDCLSEHLVETFKAWIDKPVPARDKLTAEMAYAEFRAGKALKRVTNAYTRLLDKLRDVQQQRPHLRVVGHPYVPIKSIGRPAELTTGNIGLIAWVKDDVGPWLWEPMRHVVKDKDEAREFARLMLKDGFRDSVLVPLVGRYAGLFELTSFEGVAESASDSFWNDEIHPNEQGFGLLAAKLNDTLRAVLPPSKQAAVSP